MKRSSDHTLDEAQETRAYSIATEILEAEEMLWAPEDDWQSLVKNLRVLKLSDIAPGTSQKHDEGKWPRPKISIPSKSFALLDQVLAAKVPKRTAYRNKILAYAVWEIVEQLCIQPTINEGKSGKENEVKSEKEKEVTGCAIVARAYQDVAKDKGAKGRPIGYATVARAWSEYSELR